MPKEMYGRLEFNKFLKNEKEIEAYKDVLF